VTKIEIKIDSYIEKERGERERENGIAKVGD
jgi:hypothetical protein